MSRFRIERLEDRVTPSLGLDFAFPLGAAGFDSATSTAADSAGNVYVAGRFAGSVDFDPGPGTFTLVSPGQWDGFVAKYSPEGALQWAGMIPNASVNYRISLAVGPQDQVYVSGEFRGSTDFDLGLSTADPVDAGPNSSAFVARYDGNGVLAWVRAFRGAGTVFEASSLTSAALATDGVGNVYVSGPMSGGTADLDPGAGTFLVRNATGNANTFLAKLTPSGDFVWGNMFANDPTISAGVWPADLAVDADQNVFVTGIFVGRADFDARTAVTYRSTVDVGFPYGDGYVAKLDATGGLSWLATIGASSGRDDGNGITVDAAGNAYVTGQFNGQATLQAPSGNVFLTSAGQSDLFVARLSPQGAVGWARRIGSTSFDGGLEITSDAAGGLYLGGYFSGLVDMDPGGGVSNVTSVLGIDGMVLKLGTDGSFGWAAPFGATGSDYVLDVALAPGNEVLTVGRFEGTGDLDPTPGTLTASAVGSWDGFVARLGTNQRPVANPEAYAVDEDTRLTVNAPGLLANDTDADNNPLTLDLVTAADHGILTISSDGSFWYQPYANYNGPDSFTYRAFDGELYSDPVTVSLDVRAVDDTPSANPSSWSTDEDTGFFGNATASDPDSAGLTYELVAGPVNGTVTVFPDGLFAFVPGANWFGTDSFTFRAFDGVTYSTPARVDVTVRPVNDAPILENLNATLFENTAAGTYVWTFRGTDPADNDPLRYSIVSGNTGGAFAVDPVTGDLTVANAAALDFETTPAFNLVVAATDPGGLSGLANVRVDLLDVVEVTTVSIDIRPGDSTNTIRINRDSTVEVAIFSTSSFNALDVDLTSLTFGRTGSEASLSRDRRGRIRFRQVDLNGDGRLDVAVEFNVSQTGFRVGDTLGILRGRTRNGRLIEGRGPVRIRV